MLLSMSEPHILITGASKGIGYQTALELSKRGCMVSAVARSADRLEELESNSPDQIKAYPADLSKPEQIADLCVKVSSRGPVDVVIHNAAGFISKRFEELTDDDWYELIEINLMASVRLYRNILPHMKPESHLVTVGSMGGYMGSAKFGGLSAYSTTKGALTTLSECLAVELKDRGISSNCLCLGAVQTEMFEMAFPEQQAPVSSADMGNFIADFAINGQKLFNGKVLPVALRDP